MRTKQGELSGVQREALRIAGPLAVTRALRGSIGAALLEAQATAYDNSQGVSPESARTEALRLRAEAKQLREGGHDG